MGIRNVSYVIMTKPIHAVFGNAVPGLGRLGSVPPGLKREDLETLWFKRIKKTCGGGACNEELYPMRLEPWSVFEVCYSIEEVHRAFKRAIIAAGEENVTVLQHIPAEVRAQF